MAPKVETNPNKLSKLIETREAFLQGLSLIENRTDLPESRTRLELYLRRSYWRTLAEIYPRTILVEIEKEKYLQSNGRVNPVDISGFSDQELLNKVIPHELLVSIDEIIH